MRLLLYVTAAIVLLAGLFFIFSPEKGKPDTFRILSDTKFKEYVDTLPLLLEFIQERDLWKSDMDGRKIMVSYEGLKLLKDSHPDDYWVISDMARQYGFESAEDWQSTGHIVMLSFTVFWFTERDPKIFKKLEKNLPKARPPYNSLLKHRIRKMKNMPKENLENAERYEQKIIEFIGGEPQLDF